MTAQLLDGLTRARDLRGHLAERVAALAAAGPVPALATVLVGEDPASAAYVAAKHRDCAEVGLGSLPVTLPATATTAEIRAEVARLNADPQVAGLIVQLPLPGHVDTLAVLSEVDPAKDADGLHPVSLGRLVLGQPGPVPCTPRGIVDLLTAYRIGLAGRHVVVLGRGMTVGRPLALLLLSHGLDATVTVCHSRTPDPAALTRLADIVVTAAGQPGILTADMIRPGAVVVDVGITRVAGRLHGDAAAGVADVAGALTPVPGGVGPMTRVMLLDNVVTAAGG